MKVTGLALVPPPSAASLPKVTPELLASVLARYSRSRRTDRMAGIAFTHGLVRLYGNDLPLLRWPRGLALTLLDAVPMAKRAFTRAMLFGIR